VKAPGGYETWRFEADDAAGEYRLVAELVEGCCWHGGYHAAYRAFRQRPTRLPPPVPSQSSCVHFALYRQNERIAQFAAPHGAGDFKASAESGAVAVGESHATPQQDRSIHLMLQSPHRAGQHPIVASLDFVPVGTASAPLPAPLFPRAPRPLATPTRWGGQHWWLAPMPLCEVRGSLTLPPHSGPAGPQVIPFAGRGFVDRAFGTAPPGRGLQRMMRGRLLLADRTLAFQLAVLADSRRTVAHLLSADTASASICTVATSVQWDGRTPTQMRYPTRLQFEAQPLELNQPTLLSAEAQALRLVYDLANGGGPTALCEIVYPRRLRLPGISRLLRA
jgi:hypothetical protein